MIKFLFSIALIMVLVSVAMCGEQTPKTAVVYRDELGWLGRHAAEEFAKYTNLLTGEKVTVYSEKKAISRTTPKSILKDYENIIALGITRLAVENEAKLKKLKKILGEEGFVIKTPKNPDFKQKSLLVITGTTGQATLYGIYHYFETFCKAGFFWDGDRVSKIKELPLKNINLMEKPRFEYRSCNVGGAYRGLDKFDLNYWDFELWKQTLDWLAKRKFNTTLYYLTIPGTQFFGSAFEDAYPEIGSVPEEATYQANWPVGWDWPPKYRTELTRKVLDYGRKL